MRDRDRPLDERLKELFKEAGITILSIITAVGMTISTLVVSLIGVGTGGGGGGGGDKPKPNPEPTWRDRVKAALKKFAEYLKALAKKGAAAIPGLIGSIVSFILIKAGEVVGFVAEHTVIFLGVLVTGMIGLIMRKF